MGSCYLPAYANGTRIGIKELAPSLIGEDPTQLLKINQVRGKTAQWGRG